MAEIYITAPLLKHINNRYTDESILYFCWLLRLQATDSMEEHVRLTEVYIFWLIWIILMRTFESVHYFYKWSFFSTNLKLEVM